jgi:hypothetical protein
MNREIHVRICEGLGAQSPGLLDLNPLIFLEFEWRTLLRKESCIVDIFHPK